MTTGNQHNPLASKKRTFLGNFTFNKSNYDMVLLGIVAGLTICGLAFLASSLAPREAFDFHQQFLYQLIFGVWIGGVLMYILARTDYHKLLELKRSFLVGSMIMLGFLGLVGGAATIMGLNGLDKVRFVDQFDNPVFAPFIANGSVRWIRTPIIRIQASEIAKIGLLIYFAGHLHKLSQRKVDLPISWYDLKKPLYAFLASACLIIVQPDLGSIILIYIILFSAMFVSKVPAKIYATFTLGMIGFALFFALGTGYRRARVNSVFKRNTDSSFQIDGVENAIKNGGLFGTGYGNSYAKQQGTILESTTDSIIGVIAEEMGFIITILFCSMYLWLLFRGLKIAEQAPDTGGRALATGISVWIATQAFLNIGGNLGIVPLKGLPLPFVSEGGSAIVLNLMSIGILLNISAQGIKKTAEDKIRFTKMRFDKEVQGTRKVYRRRTDVKNKSN
jgi:cell division protein FtsW